MEEVKMKRDLGLFDATMLVAGSMIGSGIFIVSSDIVRNVGSAGWLILIWVLTGLITIIAGLSFGELSSMFPQAGGQYVYLRAAYGKLTAFLFGWTFFMVIQAGSIAAVGIAFSKFASYIFPSVSESSIFLDIGTIQISGAEAFAITSIVFLTWLNSKGVKEGKILQTILTMIKIISMGGLIVLGLTLGFNSEVWKLNWSSAWLHTQWNIDTRNMVNVLSGGAIFGGFVSAMVGSVFASDAWNNVTFIGGEIKRPERNIALSLVYGTLIVTVIYISINLMYLATLTIPEIAFADYDRVAIASSQKIMGDIGTILIAVMVMISTFGCNNGMILAGARVYYSMAKDGLFFQRASILNKKGVPAWGLWLQCAWACLLCLTGRFSDLLDYIIFAVLLFYAITILGIIVLRKKYPEIERPYKVIGYPILPTIYALVAFTIGIGLLIYKPTYTWPGMIIILLGIPIYYIWKSGEKEVLSES
ncbi:MAG: amino acid permease [Chitinophagales bacterium]|nr:amino acid permease [Chitinophagales bacterium]MCZ2392672.1 amino acid permease [Chitinophagales bacterium]